MLGSSETTQSFLSPVGLTTEDCISLEVRDSSFIARTFTSKKGAIYVPTRKSDEAISRIPERKMLVSEKFPISKWSLGLTEYTVEIINANFSDVEFIGEESQHAFFNYLLKGERDRKIAERTSAYFNNDEVPTSKLSVPDPLSLMKHQELAGINACFTDGYGVYFKQGCGKTAVVCSLIAYLAPLVKQKTGKIHRSIVVCPNDLRLNWQKELNRFCDCNVNAVVIDGDLSNRLTSLTLAFMDKRQDATVCIIGYDTLPCFIDVIEAIDWHIGIADESQHFKNPATRRWSCMEKLRDKCEKRLGLTGTPYGNSLSDLYTQLEWLGKFESGFTTHKAFKDFYIQYAKANVEGQERDIFVSYKNVPFIQEKLISKSIIVSKEKALPHLPAKTIDIIESDMSQKQWETYRQLADTLMAEIDFDLKGERTLTTSHILTKLLRLTQITAGFAAWDDEVDPETLDVLSTRIEFFDDVPKMEAVVKQIQEKEDDEKVIVWSYLVPSLFKLSEVLTEAGIKNEVLCGHKSIHKRERDPIVHRFNGDPSVKVLLSNPRIGGTGLNLVGYDWWNAKPKLNTNTVQSIYYAMNWSSLEREQSSDRPHRNGTRVPVRTTDICVPGTIDVTIREKVVEKQLRAFQITDVRDILSSLDLIKAA